MIVFRRIIAVVLALVFIAMYVPILVVFRVNDTIGNPRFYVDQLQRNDVYGFAYEKALPAMLDEARIGEGPGAIDLSKYKANILAVAQQALPRDYLQVQTEQLILTVLPYVLGDTDSFSLTVPLKDRVVAAAAAMKTELNKPEVFGILYDQVIARVSDFASGNNGSTGSLGLSRADIEKALREAMSADWMRAQMNAIIDQLVPYLTGDKNSVSITIDIAGRLDALQPVVGAQMLKVETYNSLVASLSSTLLGSVGQGGFQLPLGLQLTSAELKNTVQQAFPYAWYQGIVPQITKPLFDYLKGTAGSLRIVIPLGDRKPALSAAVAQLADQKLRSYVDSLPVSTPQQLQQMLQNPPIGTLPTSRPLGFTYDQIKQLLRIDIAAQVSPLVASSMPDQWVLTDADFGQSLGPGGTELLRTVRDRIAAGYVLTEVDLQVALGAEGARTVNDIRQRLARGLVFTDQDLRTQIAKSGPESLQSFDNVRSTAGTARKYRMLLWLLPGLVLIGIGFLGGRRWSSRLMWASAVLLVTAVAVTILFGPVFSATAQPQIHQQLDRMGTAAGGFQGLLNQKAASMAENAVMAFVSGLLKQGVLLLVTSTILLFASIVWYIDDMRRARHA